MAVIPTLTSFSASTTIRSADVNSNFTAVRDAFNNTAVLTDTARTITVTHTWSASQTFSGGLSVASLTFSGTSAKIVASATSLLVRDNADTNTNVTITDAGAVTLRAGLTATSGTFSSTLAVTGAATLSSTLAVTGAVTGGTYNGQTISATASFTGTVTVATGLTVSAGGINVTGTSAVTGTFNLTTVDVATQLTFSGTGILSLGAAGMRATSGSVLIRDNTNANTNVTVADAGAVTIHRGALTVTTGGLTVSSGGASITGAVTMSSTLVVTGAATFSAHILANGGALNFSNYVGSAKVIGGTTGLLVRDSTDTNTNVTVADAGAVTIHRGALTVTTGGLTVSAGGATISGNSTITGTLGGLTGLTVASGGASITGAVTMSSTLAIGGALSGVTTIAGSETATLAKVTSHQETTATINTASTGTLTYPALAAGDAVLVCVQGSTTSTQCLALCARAPNGIQLSSNLSATAGISVAVTAGNLIQVDNTTGTNQTFQATVLKIK